MLNPLFHLSPQKKNIFNPKLGQIDDNTRKNEYLEKNLNLREDKIAERTEEVGLLKRD